MIAEHASVPRWPASAPGIDVTGRVFGVVAPDCDVARGWVAAITELGRPYWWVDHDGVARALRGATVGLRVMVAGPELDVLAASAQLRSAGLGEAELTLHATSATSRRIYCVHCTATSVLAVQVEAVAHCPSCRRPLLVFAHLADRTGSYLGFQADAELLP